MCNIGAVCTSLPCDDGQNGTCETTIWHSLNDGPCPTNLSGLDPVLEASIWPRRFAPVAPVTFQVLRAETSPFLNALGWYNATGGPPLPSDIYPVFACGPMVGSTVTIDFSSNPNYMGGEVGFALLTPESHATPGSCAVGGCCATASRVGAGEGYAYFSEDPFNPDYAQTVHLIHYTSHLSAMTHFLAWEGYFGGSDNAFEDLVVKVTGLAAGTLLVFADGFTTGDTGAWSAVVP